MKDYPGSYGAVRRRTRHVTWSRVPGIPPCQSLAYHTEAILSRPFILSYFRTQEFDATKFARGDGSGWAEAEASSVGGSSTGLGQLHQ